MDFRVVSRALLITFTTFLLCFHSGCLNSQPTYTVKGNVKLDGNPMTEGTISFEDVPQSGKPPVIATIKNGEYTVDTTAGKKLVRINLQKEVPTDMGGTKELVPTELVDSKFNSESTQTVEVKPGGPNEFPFQVKSKK